MDSLDLRKPNQPGISLSRAWLYYCVNILLCTVCGFIFWNIQLIELIAIPYLISGIILNIKVLRQLVNFHPIYDTLSNVSNTKLTAIVTWPIFYLIVYIKLAIVKYL